MPTTTPAPAATAAADATPYVVPLADIQGNVTPGFKKDFQDFIFLRFPDDVQQVRDWLKALKPHVADAKQVAEEREAYRKAKARADKPDATAQDKADLHALVAAQPARVNVAFTYAGLEKLAPAQLAMLPEEFRQGLLQRLVPLQIWRGNLQDWAVRDGLTPLEEATLPEDQKAKLRLRVADAVVIVGANNPDQLKDARDTQLQLATSRQLSECATLHGASLGTGREHLGFADGISQPDPKDLLKGWLPDPSGQVVAPGELIVGCAPEPRPPNNPPPPPPPDFALHGSYVAILRIDQDVTGFWDAVEREAKRLHDDLKVRPMSKELLGAKIIGRWPSGAPLERPHSGDDDEKAASDPGVKVGKDPPNLTAAYFGDDETGHGCPVFAHVRRAFPRTNDDARLHRIIRRSITYQDGARKGLIFVAYQASLKEGFEHIQRNWLATTSRIEDAKLDSPPFVPPALVRLVARARRRLADAREKIKEKVAAIFGLTWSGAGDLLNVLPATGAAASQDPGSRVSRFFYLFPPTQDGYADVTIPVHTTVEGGGYFFAPSISALDDLAGGVA